MKTERNILIAFILNLFFAVFEFFGGLYTGSIAIVSDAIHDAGDALGIGVSYFLERKSKKQPDEKYTYGYTRYSLLGGLITALILLVGAGVVIFNAFSKLFSPLKINYDGMIIFAVVGVLVNFAAAYFTHEGDSINQRAVNLHMVEDVLGWLAVLVGAVVMRFTNLYILDPLMSIGVSLFVIINAAKTIKEIFNMFLEKVPDGISVEEIREKLLEVEGVNDVHHIHVWKLNEYSCYATMHIVTDENCCVIKERVRDELCGLGIVHATLELEGCGEACGEENCKVKFNDACGGHCHHHHH